MQEQKTKKFMKTIFFKKNYNFMPTVLFLLFYFIYIGWAILYEIILYLDMSTNLFDPLVYGFESLSGVVWFAIATFIPPLYLLFEFFNMIQCSFFICALTTSGMIILLTFFLILIFILNILINIILNKFYRKQKMK